MCAIVLNSATCAVQAPSAVRRSRRQIGGILVTKLPLSESRHNTPGVVDRSRNLRGARPAAGEIRPESALAPLPWQLRHAGARGAFSAAALPAG
jgi:hypothetical protein